MAVRSGVGPSFGLITCRLREEVLRFRVSQFQNRTASLLREHGRAYLHQPQKCTRAPRKKYGGGGGAERNVRLCILHPETSEEKKTMGREGTTTIIQELPPRKGAKIQIAKER